MQADVLYQHAVSICITYPRVHCIAVPFSAVLSAFVAAAGRTVLARISLPTSSTLFPGSVFPDSPVLPPQRPWFTDSTTTQ